MNAKLPYIVLGMATAVVIGVIAVIVISVSSGVPGDLDADGYSDVAEAGMPLCDGVRNQDAHDKDANTLPDIFVDDGCPGGPAQFGAFSEAEFNIGTAPDRRCGDIVGTTSTAWPPDLSALTPSTNKLTLTDLTSFQAPVNRMNTKPGDANYDKRWDLLPGPATDGNNWIILTDLTSITSIMPPMAPYYGTKAYNGPPCITHDFQPTTPAQGSFFYSWFPGTWAKSSISRPCTDQVAPHNCYTVYDPTLGFYDATDTAVIDQQLALMKKAHMDFAVGSWFGPSDNEDAQLQAVMTQAAIITGPHPSLRFAVYYEDEGTLNPSVATLAADLAYLNTNFFGRENYLKVGGVPVVFAYGGAEACEMTQRWADAETAYGSPVYVVLKVFSGHAGCTPQPDSWHQYGPSSAVHSFPPYSTTISPGYSQIDNPSGASPPPYLVRDPVRFEADAAAMVASGNTWQLVTSWNEWGEGHSVEPANEFGEDYISALCRKIPASPWMPACPVAPATAILIGAGDIADCGNTGDTATATIITGRPTDTVFTAGDNAYESGTATEFTNCYDPTWGAFKARTNPALGNHEVLTAGAAGYFGYFGTQAGDADKGYYAYNVGDWRAYALNSECNEGWVTGGCAAMKAWIISDSAANPHACALAYYHHPKITAGPHADGEADDSLGIWQTLYDNGVDLVAVGHDHSYQRYTRLNRDGNATDTAGMREIIIGTGGKGISDQTRVPGQLEASMDSNHSTLGNNADKVNNRGVLKLTLRADGYDWLFIPQAAKTFTDAGRDLCR